MLRWSKRQLGTKLSIVSQSPSNQCDASTICSVGSALSPEDPVVLQAIPTHHQITFYHGRHYMRNDKLPVWLSRPVPPEPFGLWLCLDNGPRYTQTSDTRNLKLNHLMVFDLFLISFTLGQKSHHRIVVGDRCRLYLIATSMHRCTCT